MYFEINKELCLINHNYTIHLAVLLYFDPKCYTVIPRDRVADYYFLKSCERLDQYIASHNNGVLSDEEKSRLVFDATVALLKNNAFKMPAPPRNVIKPVY